MENFMAINRNITDHWIYRDAEYFQAWFEMLSNAKFTKEPKTELIENQLITLHYGEFIFGRKSWCKRLTISEKRIRSLIKKLINENMIEVVKKYPKFTIYNIVNYEKYNSQKSCFEKSPKMGHQKGHHQNEQNQQLEDNKGHQKGQQRATRGPHTKNVKNVKNVFLNTIVSFDEIFNHWINKGIIRHRKMTEKMEEGIKKALDHYSVDELKAIIDTYAEIVLGDQYKFTYKWTLDKFLERGLSSFEDREAAIDNYLIKKPEGQNKKAPGQNFEGRTSKYTGKELEDMVINKKSS